jgi:hypothetical protein
MIKKLFITILIFLSSCGYQPIYYEKNNNNYSFNKISYEGDIKINRKIVSVLSFKEKLNDYNYDQLILNSSKDVIETSKNSKGQVTSYRSSIKLKLIIKNKDKIVKEKIFEKEFSYSNLENKYDLTEYQNSVENNLINKIIEELILYINL